MEKPEISICIFSYNFAPFLRQAIDSVLNQTLNMPIEVIIGDDLSTDNSMEIIQEYAERYPSIIRVIRSDNNVGGTRNWLRCIGSSKGKYIALLDGDDYFTDELKLQKQHSLMEKQKDAALCFHGVREIYEDIEGSEQETLFHKDVFTLGDILREGWFIRTGSIFFRNHLLPAEMPDWVYDFPYRLDSVLPVMLCMHGNARYIDEVMSVWRKHSKGMSYRLHEDDIENALTRIRLSEKLDMITGRKYHAESLSGSSRIYTDLFLRIIRSGSLFRRPDILGKALIHMDYTHLFTLARRKYFGFGKA